MELEQSCEDDNDCNPNFYCYKISKRCVKFTVCSRYNRAEGSAPARSATQCGPCMTGYTTETLADGKESPICQKNITDKKHYIESTTDQYNIIWIPICVFILIFLFIILYYFRKYHIFRKLTYNEDVESNTMCLGCNEINCFAWNDTANFDAINTHVATNATNTNATNTNATNTNATNINAFTTATAPEEQSPFIECVENKYRIYDNNGPTIDNECQTATAYAPPTWVTNATQFDNNNTDVSERNIVARNNIPDNNQPAHRIQVSIARVPEVNTEQQDNARNTLLQTYPSDSDANLSLETNTSSNDKIKKNIIINQSVNQNITMNVNVFNEDEC